MLLGKTQKLMTSCLRLQTHKGWPRGTQYVDMRPRSINALWHLEEQKILLNPSCQFAPMKVKFSFSSHTFVCTHWNKLRCNFVAHGTYMKPIFIMCWQFITVQLLLAWICLQITTLGDAEELSDFFLYQRRCSSLLAFSDWGDLACDKGCLEQDTVKNVLIRWLSLASFRNLCTKLKSATWTLGPRRQLNVSWDMLWRCTELF